MAHDPTTFAGSAPHYLRGRPPYSADLVEVLQWELGLDGTGLLVDIGSGPGTLAVPLAPLFGSAIAIDPDHDMLVEAGHHAAASGVRRLGRIRALAEALPVRPPIRCATFGASFHRTAGAPVLEALHDLLEPGGAVVLLAHDGGTGPRPVGPGDPPIPHDAIDELLARYLGPRRRMGQGFSPLVPADRFEDVLPRTSFGPPQRIVARGRGDITRDVDGVISGYLSMSYAAPHLFGDRLGAFVADLRALLEPLTPTGRFWDWPGDTDIVIGRKRR
ncbi:class I SAM-dependent methyltransferase [Iamia sp. SCSIO 61187]|uniref:class I SAM-dependent methyltransferase n=1 Tax=Iamia sp. SCSIO 61187 TaxID=2722752 RepID=UPI001C62E1DE|nr:class I SAM-dependent methyltransferase [Iamia sp. SCSIO 61187]QYG92591.1 class I SAM-dependent methyltransferase [Iamia sp. SCSIO 61187]